MEAERAEQRARERLGAGQRMRPSTRLRFAEVLQVYLAEYAKSKSETNSKRESYRSRKLLDRFGSYFIDQMTTEIIKRYVESRSKEGIQPAGTNREMTLLSNIFKFSIEQGWATTNPVRNVKRTEKRRATEIPTPEQFSRLMEEAGKTRTGKQLVVYLWLRALSGIRPSEALHLEWTDIDFNADSICVRERPDIGNPLKSNASRKIEIHPLIREQLLSWKQEWEKLFEGPPSHEWVFVYPLDPSRRAKGFRTAFNNARQKAGLPNLRPYDLRHVFCSFALMNGIDKNVLRQWMGHQSYQMIDQVYAHFLTDYRRSEMAKLQIGLTPTVQRNVQTDISEPAS